MKLFDTIPKTRTANILIFDIKKETASFMRYIECSRIRNYDIKNLFFLTKDGYLWKPRKSDLATELKKLFEGRSPKSLPATLHDRGIIIDFTGYARKVPTNKANLKTFLDSCNPLWWTFMQLSKDSSQIDIIFDLYHDKSIKGTECSRQTK